MNMFISHRVYMYTGSSIYFKIVGMLFLQLNDAPVSFKRLVLFGLRPFIPLLQNRLEGGGVSPL